MANTSRINGFRAVKMLNGVANIPANLYFVPSSYATAMYPGDVVKLAGSSDTEGKYETVQLAAAGDAVVGVIRAFFPDPTNLNVDGLGNAASTARYVWVEDHPDTVFEAEASNGTPVNTDVGLNVNHAVGTPNTTFDRSGAYLDFGTEATTATLTFKILGIATRPDNEIGASCKLLVKINNHQRGSSTGTAGV
jgi:hypothetical protein